MKSILLLVAVICSVSGLPTLNERILNGGAKVATEGQFPYIVSITQSDRHFCSGFIYSPRWIVTTASCVQGKSVNSLRVVAGQVSLSAKEVNEQTLSVFSVTIFDKYDSAKKTDDIALIKLTSDIKFDDDGDAATPPPEDPLELKVNYIKYNEVDDPTNLAAQIMGWGVNIEGGEFESINLRYAGVSLVDPAADATCAPFEDFSPSNMICAGSDDTVTDYGSPCTYDEGSPLVQTIDDFPIVVGILSQTNCSTTEPSIYTRLSIYYYWFNNIAGPQVTP